jgi:hypothetical protein
MTKLSVYDVYKQDEEYQKFMSEFSRKKARFEEMASQGIYDKKHLQEVSKKLYADLENFLAGHKDKRFNETQERMEALRNKKNKLGLAERADDVKEIEMQLALADDFELKRKVDELKSTDLLELNLLRMELKKRKLDKEDSTGRNYDAAVKRYIAENQIDGMDHNDQKEYDRLKEESKIYFSMGKSFVVGEDSFTPVRNIQNDVLQTANKVVNDKSVVRNVNIDQF